MNASPACIDLIKHFEGFRSQPYNDANRNATIGYGSLLHSGPVDDCGLCRHYRDNPLDEPEADAMLRQHIEIVCERRLTKFATVRPLSQCQFDALCSFVYNEGDFTSPTSPKFSNNHLLPALMTGRNDEVPPQLLKWTYAGGKPCAGLRLRREAEVRLWLGQPWQQPTSNAKGA